MPYASKKNVLAFEQEILDTLKSEYNILTQAWSSAGWKHSEEIRSKTSEALRGNQRNYNKG